MEAPLTKILFATALAALALAGCNANQPAPSASTPAPASLAYAPSNFQMPAGAGCTGAIARYRAVADDDFATGNVNPPVYRQIKSEIGGAEQACGAGRDKEAQSMVLASRKRHGYPTEL
jgi:hypothetical protein